MRNLQMFVLVGAVALPGTCAGLGKAHSQSHVVATVEPDAQRMLSGVWVLNVALSDDVPAGDVASQSLVMTLASDVVTFYAADGSWRIYRLTGRRERQNLGSGVVWTTAAWDGTTLRLQVEGPHRLKVLQTFSVDRRTSQLIVTTAPDQRRLPMSVVRLVYDPLIDR
jgi:hypothetical protein